MPLVAVERNNHGHTTLSKLKEIYPIRHIWQDESNKMGWHTNLVSKPKMLYDLNTAINDELIAINSSRVVSEMRRYDKEDLQIVKGNEETQHFDLLMACAIGFQMKDHAGVIENFTQYRPKWISNQKRQAIPVKNFSQYRPRLK